MPEAFDGRRQLFIIGFRQCVEFVGASEWPLNVRIRQCLVDGLIDLSKGGQRYDPNRHQRSTQGSIGVGCRPACGDAEGAAVLGYKRFRRCVARLSRHPGKRGDHVSAGQGGLEPRALRLSCRRGGSRDGRSKPVAAVAPQHEPRTFRGGARRLSSQGARYRQHDADRGRARRDRGGYPDLDRRRARGVLEEDMLASDRVPIIAPNLFMEHAVSENIIAGPAMLRRAQYQFGPFLAKGVRGQVDCGLGKSMAAGSVALLRPADLIMATGDKRTLDGLEFEFQMAPNSEAPAEMHFFIPRYKLLNLAENCTHNFHNLLPFRGADVRDALAWSKYLGEALQMWGGKAQAMCGQHHWPVWGVERIDTMIRQQRDLYKFAHDQTVRLMNHGLTATEIAETIRLPASLDGAWHGRGYYGHIRHNVKAIYQKYLGWYDANPVNLDPLPPVEAGKKYVEYMGGGEAILARARKDFAKGEFRFVAQALSHRVFTAPDHQAARALLADAFEQLGYAAESATWRNAYLFGAQELRQGMPKAPPRPAMPRETLAALRTEQLWDVLGVRLNGPEAEGKHIVLNWTFTDTSESFVLTLENCALTYVAGVQAATADASFALARGVLDEVIAKLTTFPEAVASGKIKFTGNAMRLAELMALMDEFPRMFEIVEPKRVAVS